MVRRPPRSTQGVSSAASDVYKRQVHGGEQSSLLRSLIILKYSVKQKGLPFVLLEKTVPVKLASFFILEASPKGIVITPRTRARASPDWVAAELILLYRSKRTFSHPGVAYCLICCSKQDDFPIEKILYEYSLRSQSQAALIYFSFYIISVSYTHLTLPTILLVQISVVAVPFKKKKKLHELHDKITERQETIDQ
eukprot:TRINITY_DN23587_c0_g1_i5.p1 TRINITY_DN23587_c0_g1~~TRINITY_DN23587_c0_g1_i5.p1  ORF type:complete len:195 (+),score=18.90 TRINITY_DN23587_c0_g1_i5:123-707(+)